METENWRPVIGFPRYEVSDTGRVRNRESGYELQVAVQDTGHHRIYLNRDGIQRGFYVHRLVYEAFVGAIPTGKIVRHDDDDPSHNFPTNLLLGTHQDNANDRAVRGRHKPFASKFTWDQTEVGEEWRTIVGYPNHRISNKGRVLNIKTMRLMLTSRKDSGHARVGLTQNGKQRKFLVHILMYEAFIGPIPEGFVVCHEDGDGGSNTLDNFRADTQKNNLADRVEHGTLNHAERHYKSFLSAERVHEIRRAEGSIVKIAERFGLNYWTVRDIRSGKSWTNLETPGWKPRKGNRSSPSSL